MTNVNVLLLTYRATEKVDYNVESYLYNHDNILCNAYVTALERFLPVPLPP